jgi:hypothetical protein
MISRRKSLRSEAQETDASLGSAFTGEILGNSEDNGMVTLSAVLMKDGKCVAFLQYTLSYELV